MTDRALERALEQLDTDGGGPREGWEDCVLARIEVPPAPRRARWPFVAAGSGLFVAAAVALFVALRPAPDRPPPPARQPALDQLVRDIDRMTVEAEQERVLRAVTEAERAEAEAALSEAKRKRDAAGRALERLKAKARRDRAVVAKCEPDDPLCAIE